LAISTCQPNGTRLVGLVVSCCAVKRSLPRKLLCANLSTCYHLQVYDSSSKKGITHEDFLNYLFTNKEQMRTMNIIRSRFHNIFTETVNKVALSADDDKRVVMEDKISTLAIGHYRAEKYDIANIRFDD